jgi:rod shape-determining protein MreC
MRSLLIILLRYKTLILFLVLEAVALVMISTSHNYHQTVLYGISRNITGFVAERIERGTYYFRLRQVNQELLEENTLLKKQIAELSSRVQEGFIPVRDSVSGANYT